MSELPPMALQSGPREQHPLQVLKLHVDEQPHAALRASPAACWRPPGKDSNDFQGLSKALNPPPKKKNYIYIYKRKKRRWRKKNVWLFLCFLHPCPIFLVHIIIENPQPPHEVCGIRHVQQAHSSGIATLRYRSPGSKAQCKKEQLRRVWMLETDLWIFNIKAPQRPNLDTRFQKTAEARPGNINSFKISCTDSWQEACESQAATNMSPRSSHSHTSLRL